jgi:hypothetical protein
MAATTPGMVHVEERFGKKKRIYNVAIVQVFCSCILMFEQCVRALEHCDGTFLTGQFKGILLVAIKRK